MPGKLVLRTLEHVWEALEPLQFPIAVMGGIALSAWEYTRSTKDVDLLIGLASTSPDAVLRALQQVGVKPKRHPVITEVGPSRFMQLIYEPPGTFTDVPVDLLFAESDYQRQALARRLPIQLPAMGRDLFVVSCEDLILLKLLAGRIRDTADVVALLEANRSALDFDYLADWIPRLAVGPEWDEVWRRGFPGEPPPVRQ
jgi:Nucleotidyl transferase AbiEii toxin, Type IV TA system